MDYIEKAVAQISAEPVELLDRRRSAEIEHVDYSQTQTIPVPEEILRRNRLLTAQSEDVLLQAYKVLRSRVLKRMQQEDWRTLAVTSPRQGEGKTLTAINLGISIAMKSDITVLLVDLDFRRPSLARYFAIEPGVGVTDYLVDKVKLRDALINPGIERLVIFPQRDRTAGGSELLSSQKMNDMVRELRHRYESRIIIFDMPPAFVGDEVLTFSNIADTTLLVVEEGKTREQDIHLVYQHLEGTDIIGTVLNKSRDSEDTYGYGY
jgi:protein-tyrosine kinase